MDRKTDQSPTRPLSELKIVEELLSIAIAHEKMSAEYYLHAFKKATTESSKKAFSLLLEQEREHERILREQLSELKTEVRRAQASKRA